MQDEEALERITAELVETKAADGVRYVEIRWGPLLHVARGLPLADGIAAVCAGAADAAARTGTTVRLICTALRSHDPDAERGPRRDRRPLPRPWPDRLGPRRTRGGVPRSARPTPRAFEAARAGGLRITLHAGEWGGAAQVRRALAMDPERIAHGPGAADDPSLCRDLTARRVTLDLCPTSNGRPGSCRASRPTRSPACTATGVPVTLNTDDTTVSDITLSEEYENAVETIGLTLPELWAIDRHALDVAFADEADLAPLRAEFDAWAAGIPELHATAG